MLSSPERLYPFQQFSEHGALIFFGLIETIKDISDGHLDRLDRRAGIDCDDVASGGRFLPAAARGSDGASGLSRR